MDTSGTCEYFSLSFIFDPVNFKCYIVNGIEIDLRGNAYKFTKVAGIVGIADYHAMKCITPSGNDWELQYTAADATVTPAIVESKKCARFTNNGFEYLEATYAT